MSRRSDEPSTLSYPEFETPGAPPGTPGRGLHPLATWLASQAEHGAWPEALWWTVSTARPSDEADMRSGAPSHLRGSVREDGLLDEEEDFVVGNSGALSMYTGMGVSPAPARRVAST